ncbi:hypothetical protein QFZ43_000660 [Streptomyces afghaniensis]|nr:hypothetical protein [Streptomyces afghaniensis]
MIGGLLDQSLPAAFNGERTRPRSFPRSRERPLAPYPSHCADDWQRSPKIHYKITQTLRVGPLDFPAWGYNVTMASGLGHFTQAAWPHIC